QISLAAGYELNRVLRCNRSLAHEPADLEGFLPVTVIAFPQNIVGRRFAELGATLRIGPEWSESAYVDFVSKIQLGLFAAGILFVMNQSHFGRESLAGFRRNKSIEWSDLALGDEGADFVLLKLATTHNLVDHKRPVLRLVRPQSLEHRLLIGRRNDVGLSRVIVLFKIFRPLNQPLGHLDDLGHEVAPREFSVFHLPELELPFAGHVRFR